MDDVEGAQAFRVAGSAYDSFMGRYSKPLALRFADAVGVARGQTALDVGCGPGALTGVLVDRLGADAVSACDPSEPFVADCIDRYPGVIVRVAPAEAIPFADDSFDLALAQLVVHFVSDPDRAAAELCRVVRPGGSVGACVWDRDDGMEMLSRFWDAVMAVDPNVAVNERGLRFGGAGELVDLFETAGLSDVTETMLRVTSTYQNADELWAGFLAGVGPAGTYCVSLSDDARSKVKHELFDRLGSPTGPVTLSGAARCAIGRVEG
jgi:ubiquinone/menaquinone biosynthesis C-methylase UbiE